MKKFVLALALCFVSSAVLAAMNLRQQGDGTADWVGSSHTSERQNCVGGANIPIDVRLDTAVSGYGVSPISNAVIRDIFGIVTGGSTTGKTLLEFFVNQTTTPLKFVNKAHTLVTQTTLRFHTPAAGEVARISDFGDVSGSNSLLQNHLTNQTNLKKYDYIAIAADGGSSGTVTARVIVQVCPR